MYERCTRTGKFLCDDKLGRILIYAPNKVKTLKDLELLENVVKDIFLKENDLVKDRIKLFQLLSFSYIKPTKMEQRRLNTNAER